MKIENLRRKSDYYKNVAPDWVRSVWPRIQSLDHFVKSQRATLVAHGGIVRLGRDWFIEVEKFPIAAQKILGIGASA